jgi:hypothetical protein
MLPPLLRYLAVDGDLQAADCPADEQREEDEAAVRLAGAPLQIGEATDSHGSEPGFLYTEN